MIYFLLRLQSKMTDGIAVFKSIKFVEFREIDVKYIYLFILSISLITWFGIDVTLHLCVTFIKLDNMYVIFHAQWFSFFFFVIVKRWKNRFLCCVCLRLNALLGFVWGKIYFTRLFYKQFFS